MTANTTIAEKLVAKAKELGLPPQSETFIRQADTAVTDAVRKTAAYTEQNREKISSALDKAERAVDEKTQGKYTDKLAKARGAAEKGLDKVVEQRTAGAEASGATDEAAADAVALDLDSPVPPTIGSSANVRVSSTGRHVTHGGVTPSRHSAPEAAAVQRMPVVSTHTTEPHDRGEQGRATR